MEGIVSLFQFVVANGPQFIGAVLALGVALVGLFHALIALFMIIPGAEPENFLQKIVDKLQGFVDLISKFSKK